ncbi:hypothetical protein [Ktedonospora formicarum]|uniref:hypothetical protein n=1 Tax=Ktedonospora formicarum TaxID=2778364 RepID=UPI001C68CD28|nr:hypothetical protein [Ktedonospora formicarum]
MAFFYAARMQHAELIMNECRHPSGRCDDAWLVRSQFGFSHFFYWGMPEVRDPARQGYALRTIDGGQLRQKGSVER